MTYVVFTNKRRKISKSQISDCGFNQRNKPDQKSRAQLIMDSDSGSCRTSLSSSPTDCSPANISSAAAQPVEVQDTRSRDGSSGAELDSFVNRHLSSHIFSKLYENVEDQYRLEEKLGEGAMGVVRRCIEKSNGRQWACKTISKSLLTSREHVEALIDEVEIQTMVGDHSAIVGLHDVLEDAKVGRDTWQMPFQCGEGNLFFTSGGYVILCSISLSLYLHISTSVHARVNRKLRP